MRNKKYSLDVDTHKYYMIGKVYFIEDYKNQSRKSVLFLLLFF